MKGLSIQTRVFLITLIPTLIISFLLGSYIIGSRINDAELELNLYGQTILSHIVRISGTGILKNDRHLLQEITNLVLEEKDLQSITFFGPNHEVLAYSGSDDPMSAEFLKNVNFNQKESKIIKGKETITLTAPVIINDLNLINHPTHRSDGTHKKLVGWVTVSLSRTTTFLKEYQDILITMIFLSIGLLISVLLARRTARHLTRPLLKMRTAIKEIEQGKLDTIIDTDSLGEIGELEVGINHMVTSLRSARDSLENNVELQNTELVRAQKEALEASRIKSEFIANMSHEIRTPMNGIVGFTNLLLETDVTHLQRNYLTTIQKSTLNLLNLVNNILDFSRLDAGQLQLESVAFDIRDSIEEVLTIMSPLVHAKKIEFAALIEENVPHKIISDPLRFKQIMINLVSNAVKFTDKGEVIIHVTVEKTTANLTTLRISIKDTGIGISSANQKLIFTAFQQADNSIARKYGGTGLGLAICKKLIDQMGGKIGLECNQEKGSIFWFTFSAEKLPFNEEQEIKMDITVYIYDAHAATCQVIKSILTSWKIHSIIFPTADALLQQLKNQKPTLIITGADELLATLRNDFQGPIIFVTNAAEQAAFDYYLSMGASVTMTKPIIRNTLYHAIFNLLDQSQKRNHVTYQPQHDIQLQFQGKQFLCVDDNVHNANLVKALFSSTQANLVIAHDGIEALKLAEKQKFDLIFMDLRMPNMDGIETLKYIRRETNLNHTTPVIALSAHIAEHEYNHLIVLGFNDYLIKPVLKNTLFNIVKKWLKEKNHSILPVIDWQLGLKLAGNKQQLAEEMLDLLAISLKDEVVAIKKLYNDKNYLELKQRLHKLHGAVCYCGTPRLKNAITALETILKQNNVELIPSLLEQFEHESELLLNAIQAKVGGEYATGKRTAWSEKI